MVSDLQELYARARRMIRELERFFESKVEIHFIRYGSARGIPNL